MAAQKGQEIVVQVKKGVPYRIVEADALENDADAHILASDDRRLRVGVKRTELSDISSKVVDVTMCG